MPEDELNKLLTQKEIALDREVERTILKYQEEHGGEFPTQEEVKGVLGGSYRELSPSIKRVKARLQAVQSLLAKMPDMPDQLRLSGEQFMKEIWATAREKADADIVDLRRAQEAKDEDHRKQLSETEEALYRVEAECDAEAARRTSAEERIRQLESDLADRTRERDALRARLDERIEILNQLGLRPKDGADEAGPKETTKTRNKNSGAAKVDEGPDTADLPMS